MLSSAFGQCTVFVLIICNYAYAIRYCIAFSYNKILNGKVPFVGQNHSFPRCLRRCDLSCFSITSYPYSTLYTFSSHHSIFYLSRSLSFSFSYILFSFSLFRYSLFSAIRPNVCNNFIIPISISHLLICATALYFYVLHGI